MWAPSARNSSSPPSRRARTPTRSRPLARRGSRRCLWPPPHCPSTTCCPPSSRATRARRLRDGRPPSAVKRRASVVAR
eukprot:12765-Prymnesium_polylepis.1